MQSKKYLKIFAWPLLSAFKDFLLRGTQHCTTYKGIFCWHKKINLITVVVVWTSCGVSRILCYWMNIQIDFIPREDLLEIICFANSIYGNFFFLQLHESHISCFILTRFNHKPIFSLFDDFHKMKSDYWFEWYSLALSCF